MEALFQIANLLKCLGFMLLKGFFDLCMIALLRHDGEHL